MLLANTLQGAVGQFSLGIAIALTPSFVQATFSDSEFGWQAAYGFLETGLGVGNLVGGFVIGLVGARFAKGRMVIAGYAVWGLLIFLFAMTGNLGVAIGLSFGQGVANMVFIIPSQTLFQERTPPRADGSRRRDPVRARLRVDDDRDAARVGARRGARARRRSSRRSGWSRWAPVWSGWPCRRCAMPDRAMGREADGGSAPSVHWRPRRAR